MTKEKRTISGTDANMTTAGNKKMKEVIPLEVLKKLPKAELHCHLGMFIVYG